MSDIFEEVEEEVRKDRVAEIWGRFGWIVWLAAILLVGAVAIGEFLGTRNADALEDRMARYERAVEALDSGDYETSEQLLSEIIDEGADVSPMAAHLLAQLRLDSQGDRAAAGAALSGIGDPLEGGAFQRLALLKAVYLKSDTLTLAEVEAELAPLVGLETPVGALAQEMVAAKAFEEGDYERARRDYNRLRFAANAPAGLVQRATVATDAIPRSTPDLAIPETGEETEESP